MELRTFDTLRSKPASGPALKVNLPKPVFAGILALVFLVFLFLHLISSPLRATAPVQCVIGEGSGASAIGRQLQSCGVVRYARVFAVYARLSGHAGELQAGTYELQPNLTVPALVRELAQGRVLSDDRVITIPEGMNIWEIDRLLAEEGLAERGFFTANFLQNEGRYFPDTYRLDDDATATDLADKMYGTFLVRSEEYTDEQIIVASMLEKEAKTASDMALVAGVIYQRLEISMALQIDATVAYGWCLRTTEAGRVCDVTQAPIASEIEVDGPYNTYARPGLPVGPISNPGLKALKAAAEPTTSDYLYYLSTRDGSELIFSETADEHLRNRREHLGF